METDNKSQLEQPVLNDLPGNTHEPNKKPTKGKGSKWQLLRAKRAAARFLQSAKKPGRRIENLLSKGSSGPLVLNPNVGFIPAWRALSGLLHQNCLWILNAGGSDARQRQCSREHCTDCAGVAVHPGMRFVTCSSSLSFGASATADGDIYMWGNINDDQPSRWSPPLDPNIPSNRYQQTQSQILSVPSTQNTLPSSDNFSLDEADNICRQGIQKIPGRFPVKVLACGSKHITGALLVCGAIAWGDNEQNQLGIPGNQTEQLVIQLEFEVHTLR